MLCTLITFWKTHTYPNFIISYRRTYLFGGEGTIQDVPKDRYLSFFAQTLACVICMPSSVSRVALQKGLCGGHKILCPNITQKSQGLTRYPGKFIGLQPKERCSPLAGQTREGMRKNDSSPQTFYRKLTKQTTNHCPCVAFHRNGMVTHGV